MPRKKNGRSARNGGLPPAWYRTAAFSLLGIILMILAVEIFKDSILSPICGGFVFLMLIGAASAVSED